MKSDTYFDFAVNFRVLRLSGDVFITGKIKYDIFSNSQRARLISVNGII